MIQIESLPITKSNSNIELDTMCCIEFVYLVPFVRSSILNYLINMAILLHTVYDQNIIFL